MNDSEDQINLKSIRALNRDQFHGHIIAALFGVNGGFSCVRRSCLNLMSQFTGIQTCVTSISSSGPASYLHKRTAPTVHGSHWSDIICPSNLVCYIWLIFSVICQNT